MATPLRIIEINGLYVVGRPRPRGIEAVGYRDTEGVIRPYMMTTRQMAEAELEATRAAKAKFLPLALIPRLAETPLSELAK